MRARESERLVFHPLAYSPSDCNSKGWAGLGWAGLGQAEAVFICVSLMGASSTVFSGALKGSWIRSGAAWPTTITHGGAADGNLSHNATMLARNFSVSKHTPTHKSPVVNLKTSPLLSRNRLPFVSSLQMF